MTGWSVTAFRQTRLLHDTCIRPVNGAMGRLPAVDYGFLTRGCLGTGSSEASRPTDRRAVPLPVTRSPWGDIDAVPLHCGGLVALRGERCARFRAIRRISARLSQGPRRVNYVSALDRE